MKQFFISLLATITGILVSTFLLIIIGIGIIAAMISSSTEEKPLVVKDNSVLHITLSREINDRTSNNPFNFLDMKADDKEIGLNDILNNLKKAKTDDKIKGIYLDLSVIRTGMASVEEIRNALIDFKTSGKFIVSYSEVMTQKAYYLASIADKIYLNPQGLIEWKGLSAQVMFYKGTLDKLEVEAQIFRHGKFKSAIEPFDLTKMSPANREQTMTYVGSLWNQMVKGISETRKISVEELNKLADDMLIQTAEDAAKYKLIDGVKYKDELLAELVKPAARHLLLFVKLIE